LHPTRIRDFKMGEALLFFAFIGVVVYFVTKHNRKTREEKEERYKLENFVKSEDSVNDTRNFSFEEAVGGCYFAAEKISKLNEQINDIDEIMSKQMKTNGIKNIVKLNHNPEKLGERTISPFEGNGLISKLTNELSGGIGEHFQPNENYPESEKTKQLRAFPKETKEEFRNYPWRFNLLPRGSRAYILQEKYNEKLEEIHRFYYDTFLPCKSRADILILEKSNENGDLVKDYCNIITLDKELKKCTPRERINDYRINQFRKIGKITLTITGATVLATTFFLNNGGKGMFTSSSKDN